ncbi:MAG: hypothetical protein AAF799_10580 [Myxococcota bacterium]
MLDLDTALELNGVTLYGDHARPGHYYYLPGVPRIARDRNGWPLFELLVYRGDAAAEDAGGFLTMTVDLGITETAKNRIRDELKRQTQRDVTLAALPIDAGTVRISALSASTAPADEAAGDGGPSAALVEDILGSAKPSSYGDNRAVFSMSLTRKGAQLMEASLRDPGATQIAVVYDLRFTGLLPARHCTIKINYDRSYTYLREKATSNTLWLKSDIDREVERLRTEGSIDIDDKDFTNLDAAAKAARAVELQNLARELAQWTLFSPSLNPGAVLATDRGSLNVHDPTAQALAMPWVGQSRSVAGLGYGQSLDNPGPTHTGTTGTVVTTRANGDELPTEGAAGDAAADDAAADGGDAAAGGDSDTPGTVAPTTDGTVPEAVARWNEAGRPQAGYLLRSLTQEERQEVTYELRQASAVQRTIAPQGSISVAARGSALADRIKRIDLNNEFFERIAGSVTTATDFDVAGVTSMGLKIRYGQDSGGNAENTAEFVLRASSESFDYAFYRDEEGGHEMEYQVIANYRDEAVLDGGALRQASEWIRTTDRNLTIDPRVAGDAFQVRVEPGVIDWQRVGMVEVRLDLPGTDNSRARSLLLREGNEGKAFMVRSASSQDRQVKLTTTYHTDAGTLGPVERVFTGASTVLLSPPLSLLGMVELYFVDPLEQLDKVLVELEHTPPGGGDAQRGSFELNAGAARATWSFTRTPTGTEDDEKAPQYRFRTTRFSKDGSVDESPWQPSGDGRQLVGHVAAKVLQLPIMMGIGDLGSAGFQSVLLMLQHPDVTPWANRMTTMVLRDANPASWRVPLTRDDPGPYSWTATWVTNAGQRIVDGPHETNDPLLFLIPPSVE